MEVERIAEKNLRALNCLLGIYDGSISEEYIDSVDEKVMNKIFRRDWKIVYNKIRQDDYNIINDLVSGEIDPEHLTKSEVGTMRYIFGGEWHTIFGFNSDIKRSSFDVNINRKKNENFQYNPSKMGTYASWSNIGSGVKQTFAPKEEKVDQNTGWVVLRKK